MIATAGKPVDKLTPIEKTPKRRPGALKGTVKIAKDFDDPLLLNEMQFCSNCCKISKNSSLQKIL